MSRKIVLCGAAAFTVAASLFVTPAYAAEDFPITVTPDAARPGEKFTVSGTATEPTCAEDGVAVSLHYTKPDGDMASTVVNTTTDEEGAFTVELTVPDTATAEAKAHVSAVIADCNPPDEEPVSRSSEAVEFSVEPHEGAFEISKTTGRPGEKLEFAGDTCYGGAVEFYFDEDTLSGKPDEDRTFAGVYTLPDLPTGTYPVTAACPGSAYEVLSFRLVNPAVVPPAPAPPARPVPGAPTFTG